MKNTETAAYTIGIGLILIITALFAIVYSSGPLKTVNNKETAWYAPPHKIGSGLPGIKAPPSK